MMNTKITIIAFIGLSLISGASLAAKNNGMQLNSNMPQFSQIDINQDQAINPTEFEQFRQQRISERKAEGRMMKNQNQTNKFDVIDQNNDGLVDPDEFNTHQVNNRMAKW